MIKREKIRYSQKGIKFIFSVLTTSYFYVLTKKFPETSVNIIFLQSDIQNKNKLSQYALL